jgi:uncharacterized protein YndB with AHSA1/START domain
MSTVSERQPVVRLRRRIPAPPGRVYRAWLEPDLIRRWLSPGEIEIASAEVQERVGGRYRIWHEDAAGDVGGFECELVELAPAERIVFRWGFAGPARESGPVYDSLLTVTFAEAPDGGTELTLVHERLDELREALPEVADAVSRGWTSALDKLARSFEEGER